MILRNRSFKRQAPSREAKSIYIFCEGAKREYQYFCYFKEIDSRINIEVYELAHNENNSPRGLLNIALQCTESGEASKYSLQENDEVWIVIDIDKDKLDSRSPQIKELKAECAKRERWYVVQSNPCFEVWLYNHLFDDKPNFEAEYSCTDLKRKVNNLIPGGFSSKKHPILIQDATINAESNYSVTANTPDLGCTEVFMLSKSMLPLLKHKLDQYLEILKLKAL